MNDRNKSKKWTNEDDVIYVPDEAYHGFHRALDQIEQAREELRKATEEKPKK